VAQWISIAQSEALGLHAYIVGDGRKFPKSSGHHAEEGGEVLSGGTLMEAHRLKIRGIAQVQKEQEA
jgi:hypothetical protein